MLPACVVLFLVGRRSERSHNAITTTQQPASDLVPMLWGTTSCALAFFLASFQVHEKSILLALAPASLLAWEDSLFCDWFAIVATWTMWPLLVVDRLQVAYACVILIFAAFVSQMRQTKPEQRKQLSWIAWGWTVLCKVSVVAMVVLHALEMVITVPSNLPDLFPVLWSVGGCALCCLAWAKATSSLVAIAMSEGTGKLKDD